MALVGGTVRAPDKAFWHLETREEAEIVDLLLRRRFGRLTVELSDCFDRLDPLDIVYPGNPREYVDVVRELLVRLHGAELAAVEDFIQPVLESFEVSFGEQLDDASLAALAHQVASIVLGPE